MSDAAVRALPIWRGEVKVEPLSGGLTNLNYRVTDGDHSYAVRTGHDDPLLGIYRDNELSCTQAAAGMGIAPRVVYSAPGVLVSDFVDGSTPLTPELAQQRLPRLASVMRTFHEQGRQVRGHLQHFSSFQVARTYVQIASERGLQLPASVDAGVLLSEVADLEAQLRPFQPTFCHNDMMPANFLDTGNRLWVIDWEYAGIGHPLFDVAGLASNCELDAAQDRALFTAYMGGEDDAGFAQFQLLKAMAALRESLWAVVQGSQTEIEFDYDGYREDNYRKFRLFLEACA